MSRSSIKYIENNYIYGQKTQRVMPVSNPVIYGNFPKYSYNKSYCEKINKVLKIISLMLVMLSLVSYYFVSDREKTMNMLGREIVALSSENIELQNKLDNLNSFNKVDNIITAIASLDTAKKVMEIPAVNMVSSHKTKNIPVNYNWSIGY